MMCLLLLICLGPGNVFAAFQPPPAEVGSLTSFQPWRDEYRTDFGWPPPANWDTLRLYFETNLGVPYELDIPQAGVISRVMYLTCNGTYQIQFLSSGTPVYWTGLISTTQIVTSSCNSYADGGSRDDLNANYTNNSSGGWDVSWDGMSGADSYEVWQDGQLVETISGGGGGSYHVNEPGGAVTIVGKDSNGNYVGHSDLQVPEYNGQDGWGEGGSSGCDMCKKIRDALACPEWDTYMGELTGAIKAALPTLPEWRQIAGQFVNAFGEYFGDPPAVPSVQELKGTITPTIPVLDTSTPELELSVPEEFEEPMNFDVTNVTPIPVVDESEPFEIVEPGAYLEHDEPGVFVYPGDPRNSSGGIKEPDRVETGYPEPEPELVPDAPEGPEIPPAEIPVPGTGGSNPTPLPEPTEGVIPIPRGGTP